MKTLYQHADILIFENDKFGVLKNAFLGVEDAHFCYVSSEPPSEEYDVKKEMCGKLIAPAFYNCHAHSPMVLLRGVGSDLPLQQWLFEKVFPIEDRLTEECVRVGSDLAILEMIAGGTVGFSDMYFFPDQTAQAAVDAGVKANICRVIQDFAGAPWEQAQMRLDESTVLYNKWNGAADGRILVDFSVHAEYTCSEKATRACAELCKEYAGNMHIHLSETVSEHNACIDKYGKTPAKWFYDLGVFDSRAFAAHCVALDDADMDLLKEKGVSVVHNPTSNMKLGSGFARIPEMLDMGINVCLGTDGAASNNNLNMFEEMHLAAVIHNGIKQDASVMPASTVLRMATANGAMAQGRFDCGSIKPGNRADFVAIDMDKPHLTPCIDVTALMVYSAQASDVCMTVCDGRVLFENGVYYTVDKEKVLYDVNRILKILYD